MTKKELEQRNAQLEEGYAELSAAYKQLIAERNKPSAFRNFWDWAKPYIIPFIFGVIVGGLFVFIPTPTIPFVSQQSAKLEHQAAIGGAAVPFPSGSSSLPPLNSPPSDWMEEPTDSSLTTTSEEPSPSNPQADNGQKHSTRFYRLPLRRMR